MGSRAVRAALPPSARTALRETFAREVTERLPRIQAWCVGGDVEQDTVRRDAHTLASGAWVVEEPEISRLARAVEEDLEAGPCAELVASLQAFLGRPAL